MKEKEMQEPVMVSIRCTVYNHEPYIRQCLEGFVMQKTNFRFEAIVHDDASTDGSALIIREFAEKYPDIIKPIYETENQYSKHDGSLTRIMNAQMRGKYVALCEGDDYWIDPNKLQMQVDWLESHPDFSMCWTDAYLQEGTTRNKAYNRYPTDATIPIKDIIMNGGMWIPTASILLRKEVYQSIPRDSNFHVGDYPLQIWSAYSGLVRYLAKQTCVYRVNSVGSWSSRMMSKSKEELYVIWEREHYLLQKMNEFTKKKHEHYFEQRWHTYSFFNNLYVENYSIARGHYIKLDDKPQLILWQKLYMDGFPILSKIIRCLQLIKHKMVNTNN